MKHVAMVLAAALSASTALAAGGQQSGGQSGGQQSTSQPSARQQQTGGQQSGTQSQQSGSQQQSSAGGQGGQGGQTQSITNLPEEGEVSVSGTVSYIDSLDNEFTLRDESGSIDIEQEGEVQVSVGDRVRVNGSVSDDMGEKEINASRVTVTQRAEESARNQ